MTEVTRPRRCPHPEQFAPSRPRRLNEFISTASHELRTPLTSLQATLELLKEETLSGACGRGQTVVYADRALRQTRRLVTLATDLLDISRLDGDAPLALQPVDLAELAQTIRREFAARLQADGRCLRVEGGPAVAPADPRAAARILRILLDNAAAHGAGTVTVAVSTHGVHVLVAVADEGPGVAAEEREHIFGRFARGRAAVGATAGAGLGLAIARGLARAMGGDLEAARVSLGARFVPALRAEETR
jgi:signal transduction histidine kinase